MKVNQGEIVQEEKDIIKSKLKTFFTEKKVFFAKPEDEKKDEVATLKPPAII